MSWSTADSRIEPLADLLRAWLLDLFDGEIDFFFSQEIEPGDSAMPSIYEALNGADLGFVFLSQRTARSPWVIYESGCLNPSLRKGKVFPLLFDLTPRELMSICPPLAEFQAVSLRNREHVRRLVEKVCRLIGLDQRQTLRVKERFHRDFPELEQAIRTNVDSKRMLPDRFSGTIAYNESIGSSGNFQLPELFRGFDRELLLVGINFNFLLNLRNNTENLAALLDVLIEDPRKQVRILICDLWDEKIFYTYDKIVFGNGRIEFPGLHQSLAEPDSPHHIDRFIRARLGDDGYDQVRTQLRIKKIGLLVDTFWFVDPDSTTRTGDMLFALMTASTGRDRPVFYVNQAENPTLYAKHFDMCRAAFDLSSDILWPVDDVPRRVELGSASPVLT